MNLKTIFQIFLATVLTTNVLSAQFRCLQEFSITVNGSTEDVYGCIDDDIDDIFQVRSDTYATPIGYLVADENDIIVQNTLRAFLNVSDLPEGNYRIYGYSFLGTPALLTGIKLEEAVLANICYELSDNFVRLFTVDPDGETIATSDGKSSLFVCSQDQQPNLVEFQTTSQDPNYGYLITNSQNNIVEISTASSYDFEGIPFDTYRVWGFSYVGNITANVGDNALEVMLAEFCFDLSDNFIEVVATEAEGGQVQLTTGEKELTVCTGDRVPDILNFEASGQSNAPYRFILTDINQNILLVLSNNAINVDFLAPGTCRIYGVSFTGDFTGSAGSNLNEATLSTDCFDISDDFIAITKKNPNGGTVRLADGMTSALFCTNDNDADLTTLTNNGGFNENYAYLLLDESEAIIEIIQTEEFDFEGLGQGTYQIVGLAYTGNITATIGGSINDLLSDECFELSSNSITITSVFLEKGSIALSSGSQDTVLCFGDSQTDLLDFTFTSSSTAALRYVVVDEDDNILTISESSTIDFAGVTQSLCKVVALTFTGELSATIGASLSSDVLSTECYQTSEDEVVIRHVFVEGGTVSLSDGLDTAVVCVQDGAADVLQFVAIDAETAAYAFVLTDVAGNIFQIVTDTELDFDNLNNGVVSVYGYSYSGEITAQVGDNVDGLIFSSECFDRSDNALTITNKQLEAGTIALATGSTDTLLCFGDPGADVLDYQVSGFNNIGSYRYLITDDNNVVLDIVEEASYEFLNITVEACRIWGLSFTGDLLVNIGDDAAATVLAGECYDLTDNFIQVQHNYVEGGSILFTDGNDSQTVCVQDDVDDFFSISVTGGLEEQYAILITDVNGIIEAISTENAYNFDSDLPGEALIYGVSYTGDLTASIGDDVNTAVLASSCFDISDNTLAVTKKQVESGAISLEDGSTSTIICFGDPTADTLSFQLTGAINSNEFRYVVTDRQDNILGIFESSTIPFEGITVDDCRVYAVSFTGSLNLNTGDNLLSVIVSDECYDISDNFVSIEHQFVEGGAVNLSDGSTRDTLCVADGIPDIVSFETNTTSTSQYSFILTDGSNNIIFVLSGSSLNLDIANPGICRIWGVSYTGTFSPNVGTNVLTGVLADGCYDLSDNFIQIVKKDLFGGAVSLASGSQDTSICMGDFYAERLELMNDSPQTDETYAYFLTDENNQVLSISTTSSIVVGQLEIPSSRIWGAIYTGNLSVSVGDVLPNVAISDQCYELSSNFITVDHKQVDGSMVSLENGASVTNICVRDGAPDLITLSTNTNSTESYAYLLTDENNRLLNALSSNSVDLDNSFGGEVRFWGVSFTGEISVAFGSDVTQAVLSTDCYDLSDNFVRVNKIELVPGEVSLINGLNSTAICFGDGVEDRLQFTNTANTGSTYGYVLTDQADNIISVSPIPEILIEEQDLPGARVYGFAYSGTINTAATGNVFSAILSTECSDLTDNFVDIEFIQLDGAQVSLSGGATEITICANDGVPDILSFETSSDADGEYAFVLTDANDNVLIVLSGNSFNFDNVNPGVCRIWGISYFGDIDINFGDNLLTAPIADDCFDLSDNAIEITKDEVIGGAISFTDGSSSAIVCPDGNPDVLSFITTGTSTANYGYLITDQNNVVLGISENNSFDFETVNAETIRTWGIAYSGDITIQIGETVSNNLASNCANLSSNFLVVNKQFPDGGMISTSDQLDNYNICLGDDNANLIELSNNSTFVGNYIYVLTNQEGEFIKVIEGNNIDLENEAAGIYRIYGLAFTGQFIAIDGTIIEEEALSDNCFDPSDNFISIISDAPSVGSILDGDKSNIAYVCPNDGQPNVIDLFPTDASFNPLVYIITDENDIILSISTSNSIDFDDNLPANTRVYGVSYSGTLNMNLGDDINNSMLSNECAVLSDNFYEVIIDQPEAGLLTTQNGEASSFRLCVNDGNSDVFTFETNSNSLAQYLLLITDENDVLIDTVHSFDIDFETDEPGINRVWGISYTGNFNLQIGQSIFAVALSDDCFEVTENFIELRKTQVDGGTINSAFDSNPIYVCPLDGVADSITFTNSGAAASDQYTYLLTNRNGLILDYLEDGTFDFDDTGFRELRVYGLSYTGSLNDNVARGINTSIHSDSCYALSNNFITVFMDIPDGGTISSADGATSVDFCASPRNATLSFAVDNNSQAGYAYIMVDDSSKVVAVSDSNSFDMSTIAIGSYQVYGISYTGLVIANVGDDIQSANLASSCFDLSTNTVIVNKLGDVDGGAIAFFDGSSELYSCPGDGSPDLAILTSNSSAQLENYVYVFTDENNNILVPNAGSTVIDFDRAAPIVYRIWAVSYTGDYTASTADDILEDELSSDCAEVSENFLTVFNTGATGGTVSTTDSLTELGVTALETISLMASDPIGSDYIYVLTDDLDRIIEASLDNTISTTDLITGDYRIYGLALNGNFTGLLGENINEAQLSDECFGLSDNFVSFRIDESQTPIVAEEEENITFEASTRLLEVEVRTWPNPASNEMTINLEVKTDMQSNMVLNIVNIYGQQMKSMQLDGKTQQFTVNIADLENGLYIISIETSGQLVQKHRFMKVD